MKVQEIMTARPATCMPDTSLQEVAQMMVECDCGAIPVVESGSSKRPAGIITDRDIVTRILAKGQNPLQQRAADAMTRSTVTLGPGASVDEAAQLMKAHQVRRLLVVDDAGDCVGIVAQADLARHASEAQTGDVVEEISEPSDAHSRHASIGI